MNLPSAGGGCEHLDLSSGLRDFIAKSQMRKVILVDRGQILVLAVYAVFGQK